MKAMLTAAALSLAATMPAWGQAPAPFPGQGLGAGSAGAGQGSSLGAIARDPFYSASRTKDPKVRKAENGPELTPADNLKAPSIELPNEPIEPYLLTKDVGPFMVLARTFRGPDSERMALALVKELRNDFGLPAFILRTKDYPGKSLIRGAPPTAGSEVMKTNIRMPEKIRTMDEASVLVGNEKTLAGSEKLLKYVKTLDPKCLKGMSSPYWWRKGLSYALRTTNPYVAAQNLYPKTRDRLMIQMNSGNRSIANCPGRFSLQVAEFSGRTSYIFNGSENQNPNQHDLRTSPLRTAATDAERLADKLARQPEFQQLGQPVYVYHDRTSSRVYVGSFNSAVDRNAGLVREQLLKMAVPMLKSDKNSRGLDTMIVPAIALTDLDAMKEGIK